MITKPEKIKKRILKAVGNGQSVLIIGEWEKEFLDQIKKNNAIVNSSFIKDLEDNIFTRIVIDYETLSNDIKELYKNIRRLLLPTGMLIVTAKTEIGFFEKIMNTLERKKIISDSRHKIKPKILQDQIHDNGFLIDGYYGYPGGDILMMAIIQNKEVSTLFGANKQETL